MPLEVKYKPMTSLLFALYIMGLKVSDPSGEAWLSAFNDEAEKILGCSADELDKLKSQVKLGQI
jgi:hypothetical protein